VITQEPLQAKKEGKAGLLSVAIITKNEAERLPGCLRSLSFSDEIVVVDSGSLDDTVRIAESFGARVLVETWRGYAAQKQFAVEQCRHKWVLVLDADERVPAATAKLIVGQLARNNPAIAAYSFKRKNYLHGRWIRHCGWWPDRIVRLVDRTRGAFDGRPVHERWITDEEVRDLDACIEHVSFRRYSDLVSKMETYSNLSSRELFERDQPVSALTPVLHGAWMFLKTYLLELGFLEGFDGFTISIMNAGGSFLKYAKLRELKEQAPTREGVD
jgi:glycosyltransferase involved in cell wall biosynthesis